MITLTETPQDLIDVRNTWANERDKWWDKVEKEEEVYYQDVEGTGTNFTQKQIDDINKKGSGIPININLLYPLLNQELAMLSNSKPSFRLIGLDNRGKQYAEILDKAVKSIMYKSESVGEEEETVKNMLTMGMGISMIEETDFKRFGEFGINFIDVHPSTVLLDSNSRKRSLKDAKGFFIEKEITYDDAVFKYSGLLNAINQQRAEKGEEPITMDYFTISGSADIKKRGRVEVSGEKFEKIEVREYYDKKLSTMYFVPDENGNVLRIFKENLGEDAEFLLGGAKDAEDNLFVRKTLMLGNYVVSVEMLPITDFPIKVKFFEWGGFPYRSYGLIHFTLAMQEVMDKAIQLMIQNGMLTNNAGYTSPKGGIPEDDKSKWENEGGKPGAVKEYVPTVIQNQVFKPEREQIQQLSSFYPMLIQMMQEGIRVSTGINGALTGDPNEAGTDVFSTLKQYQNSAMERVKLAMSHINLANQQLGNVVLEYLLANIRVNEKYVFFDDRDQENELNVVKQIMEELSLAKYKVLSVNAEIMPTQRLQMANSLMQISQTTPDAVERNIYIQKAFELSDMRGFDDIQEQIDTAKKLQGQVSQLQEKVKRDEELLKQMQNKSLNSEYEAKLTKKLCEMEKDIEITANRTEKDIEIEKLKEQLKESNSSNNKTKEK